MKTKIAFQGVLGAYSHEAMEGYCKGIGIDCDPVPQDTFKHLFEAIDGDIGIGLVPIENTTTGSVVPSHDLLIDYKDFEIIGEYVLPVNHCLLGVKGAILADITTVISHPQALGQCERFLNKHNLTRVSRADTAGSAKEISQKGDKTIASLASSIAAELYGLSILKEGVQDNQNNKTRFVLVRKKDNMFEWEHKLPKPNKTSLIFETRDIPAALYKCLGGFATNDVNLVKLESRPLIGQDFRYLFYLDFLGTPDEKAVNNAFDELNHFSENLRILGTYASFL